MKYAVKAICTAILVLLVSLCMAVVAIEWLAGCGETYVDADGVRHQYECVFIPQPTKENKL
jgi:hypothetical protein